MNSQHMHHIQEMWDEINSLHLSYLQTEECLKKIGEKTRLEDVIRQYLSLVPHRNKFLFPKISYVLQNSLRDKKDFSPSKAISAWSALAKYAHNILTQPWRKEFYAIQTGTTDTLFTKESMRNMPHKVLTINNTDVETIEIKTIHKKYGGFFSHVIREVLVDWEVVFELMGYNNAGDIMILDEPIDPDRVTYVARDCFIAQVECQIIVKIYAKVLKIHSDCTWQDVLEFRENHICSTEQAINGLCSIFLQRQQQDEFVRDSCVVTGSPYTYSTLPPYHSSSCMRHHNDYKPVSPYESSINITPHNKIGHDKCDFVRMVSQDYNYQNCGKHVMPQNLIQSNDAGYHVQHYPDSSGFGLPYTDKALCPQYIYSNNTQYPGIGVDERDHCTNCHGYNYGTIYPYTYSSSNNKYIDHNYDYHRNRSKTMGKYEDSIKQNSINYQQMLKKNKDSFLSSNVPKCAPVTVTDLENAMKAFSLDFDKNTVSDNEQLEKTAYNKNVTDNKQLLLNRDKSEEKISREDLWECKSCTFHNSPRQAICELCAKSRNTGNEKTPLISGGRQCHQCTLVNERHATMCVACDNSLKDSPTYI